MPDDIISKRRKQSIALRNLFWVTLGIIVLSSLAVLVINAVIGLQSRGVLYDCTVKGGDCYEASIGRANARTELTRDVIILTAVCAEEDKVRNEPDRVTRIRLIEQCVSDNLKEN